MIVTMQFSLPEEQEEFRTALSGGKAHALLGRIREHLRNKIKYAELNKETLKELHSVQDVLFSEEGLDF